MRAQIPVQAPQQVREAAPEHEQPKQQLQESHGPAPSPESSMQQAAQRDTRERAPQPIVKEQLPGRNDPCPCGSGKKFKNCHGKGL
jgi:preprotein translocase subunit SecA